MEGSVVNKKYIEQIEAFFFSHYKDFVKISEVTCMPYGPFFEVKYSHNGVVIIISGEYGFNVDINICNSIYDLSQYDKSVLQHTEKTVENLSYILSVLDKFLKNIF